LLFIRRPVHSRPTPTPRSSPRIDIPIVCHLGLSKMLNQLLVGSERHWRHHANFRGDTLRGCVDTTFRPIEFKMAAIRHVWFLPEIVFLREKLLGVWHISPKFINLLLGYWVLSISKMRQSAILGLLLRACDHVQGRQFWRSLWLSKMWLELAA